MRASRKKKRRDSVFLFSPDLDGIKRFIRNLNDEYFEHTSPVGRGRSVRIDLRPTRKELRRLVRAWMDSGPNVSKLFKAEPALAAEARSLSAEVIVTRGRTVKIGLGVTQGAQSEPYATALPLFLDFLMNPYNDWLGGPCAYCGNYFERNPLKESVYCDTECGHRFTSRQTNQDKRDEIYVAKLACARRLLIKWSGTKTKKNWKDWVSSRNPSLSKNILTRMTRMKGARKLIAPNEQA